MSEEVKKIERASYGTIATITIGIIVASLGNLITSGTQISKDCNKNLGIAVMVLSFLLIINTILLPIIVNMKYLYLGLSILALINVIVLTVFSFINRSKCETIFGKHSRAYDPSIGFNFVMLFIFGANLLITFLNLKNWNENVV